MPVAPARTLILAALALGSGCGGARAGAAGDDGAVTSAEARPTEHDAQLEATRFAPDLNVALPAMTRMPTGIRYRDIAEGSGTPAEQGREVRVSYIAFLADGTEVDRTAPGAPPIAFTVGSRRMIRGLDLGVRGMKAGGSRQIVLPSQYAYGSRGSPSGGVPRNAVMVFLVRVDGVR